MIPLDNASSAWLNYFTHLVKVYNEVPVFMTVERVANNLTDYNGVVLESDNGWVPYFKSEQDLSWFVMKWS